MHSPWVESISITRKKYSRQIVKKNSYCLWTTVYWSVYHITIYRYSFYHTKLTEKLFIFYKPRVIFFFLQNPQFENFTTYVIFAHLLRQIAALTDQDHHFLVHWMKGYAKIVYNYKSFVCTHLFHAFGFNQTS